MVDTKVPSSTRPRVMRAAPKDRWRRVFLNALAATSNVTASAKAANVPTSKAYDARRKDAAFYRAWQEALCEGYEHLEMALLHRLREGEVKAAPGAKRGVRVFDNATALRLLIAHRDSVSRQQAIRGNEDAQAVIAEINARIMKLRKPAELEAPVTIDAAAEPCDD